MMFSGMLRRVALVRTDVSEAPVSSETSVLTRATQRNIPEDTILNSHRRENLKFYIIHFYSYNHTKKCHAHKAGKVRAIEKLKQMVLVIEIRSKM
jgi:hypothetical protein